MAPLLPALALSLLQVSILLISPAKALQNSSFVGRDGMRFIQNGQPFLFAGTNNYYITNRPTKMAEDLFVQAKNMGITVIRTWAFNAIGHPAGDQPPCASSEPSRKDFYFQYWDNEKRQSVVNEGATGIQRLDYALKLARDHNIKLILALTNNWLDFGGLEQYNLWYGVKNRDEFFTSEVLKDEFKKWMTYLTNRVNPLTGLAYKDDPAILAWELINEPRCKGCGDYGTCNHCPGCGPSTSGCNVTTITEWADEMSSYLKHLDKNHLVGVGDEGFLNTANPEFGYNGQDGDHEALMRLPHIDFGTVHCYVEQWNKDAKWVQGWIRDHVQVARRVNKPQVFEEFGLRTAEKDNPMALDPTRNSFYDMYVDEVNNGKSYWAFWMLSAREAKTNMAPLGLLYPDYDGYTVYWEDVQGQVTPSGKKMGERAKQSFELQKSW